MPDGGTGRLSDENSRAKVQNVREDSWDSSADPQNRLEQFRILQRHSSLERSYQQPTSTSIRRRAGRPFPAAARTDGLTRQPDPLTTEIPEGPCFVLIAPRWGTAFLRLRLQQSARSCH